jgi:hypothetical protein
LTNEWLCARIEQARRRSLFVIGTADGYYKPEILQCLVEVTNGQAVVIEGADHGLEVAESIPRSLQGLGRIVRGLQEFLGDG